MGHFTVANWYTIIRKHIIMPILRIIKFIFLLLISVFLYWVSFKVMQQYPDVEYLNWIFFVFIFGLVNYAFLSFIFYLIYYYFDLIVIYKDQIVMIKCSLLLRDDIEVIDAYRIMKVDGFSRGLMANIIWYGNLVIEQQKDDVRTLHFVPKPYKILLIIQKQRTALLDERKKKYIITEEEDQVT